MEAKSSLDSRRARTVCWMLSPRNCSLWKVIFTLVDCDNKSCDMNLRALLTTYFPLLLVIIDCDRGGRATSEARQGTLVTYVPERSLVLGVLLTPPAPLQRRYHIARAKGPATSRQVSFARRSNGRHDCKNDISIKARRVKLGDAQMLA
jgi:hypothetical protein